jgi:hypothetical protein
VRTLLWIAASWVCLSFVAGCVFATRCRPKGERLRLVVAAPVWAITAPPIFALSVLLLAVMAIAGLVEEYFQ